MNTRNWQIKILTLCMAAFTLCLAAACGDAGPERITPSAPCGDDAALTPSLELTELHEGWKRRRGSKLTIEGLRVLPGYQDAMDARERRLIPKRSHIWVMVLTKYEGRMHEYPYVHGYAPYALYDENGWPTDKIVVEIYVTQMVDQETLPPEDRIPECMEGVPVHFIIKSEATFD